MWKRRPNYNREPIEWNPEKENWTKAELEQLADQLLKEEARAIDPETGKKRGIGGENPILFDEHIYKRQQREILNVNGIPDPSITRGIYHRPHPEGRKLNTEAQRKAGSGFYRS